MKEKILEVSCNGLMIGGVQRVIMNIVQSLHEEFIFDILVFTDGPDYFDEEFRSLGGNVFRIPNKNFSVTSRNLDSYLRGPRIFWGTLRILRQHGPYAAIHCHNYFESAYCLLAARIAGVKVRIAHSHNDVRGQYASFPMRIKRRLLRPIMNQNATVRIGCSKPASDYLFGENIAAITVFNGIDIKKFEFGEKSPGYSAGEKIRLLHVGNFNRQKNQLFLVDVLSEISKRKIPFTLKMIGGGDERYREMVINKIQQNGLEGNVVFLPPNTDIPEQMRQADLLLLPSLFEGLGIVLIEAQASGLHCFASDNVPREADLGNVDFIAGLVVSLWADAIERVFQFGQPRCAVDAKQYDLSCMADTYRHIYRKGKTEEVG